MVSITATAAEKVKEIMANHKSPEGTMVRIIYGGSGWGGPRLDMTLDESKHKNDTVVEAQGIKIVYSSEIEKYVKHSIIDYSNNWFERGFVIRGSRTSSC